MISHTRLLPIIFGDLTIQQCPNVPIMYPEARSISEYPILFPASSLISSGKGQASKVSKATGGTFCPSGSVMTISLSGPARNASERTPGRNAGGMSWIPLDLVGSHWMGERGWNWWCLGLLEWTKSGVLVSQNEYLKAIQVFPIFP